MKRDTCQVLSILVAVSSSLPLFMLLWIRAHEVQGSGTKFVNIPSRCIPVSNGNLRHLEQQGSNTVFVLMIGEQCMKLKRPR